MARMRRADSPQAAGSTGEALDKAAAGVLLIEAGRVEHFDARVLLAEDNPVNQEVAKEMLRLAGCEVELAETGRSAVEMARSGGYDLILMDVQMPELDGIEASRQIRALPGLSRVPIVAMTANAFAEDRAACLAAGMNDHVAKPVQPAALHDTLARWLPPASARSEPAPLMPQTGDTWFAVPGLDTQTGLRYFAGRTPAYEQAVRQFVELYSSLDEFDPDSATFNRAGNQRLREALHSLGGASVVIGALPLYAQSQALGALLRGRAGEVALKRELEALRDALAAMVAALRARLSTPLDSR